ncbi:hypothetical protein NDU88_002559 [Pleurodeles waltl]|uniref:Uncharacterized protein n=1 Tax=Pleurodeles waltl TaxID=8319 RepID=A0AAV7M0X8_PLEWA|nr:hypothetical protein NDU88_002559 [Pleurodeles waltl]
MRSSLLIQGEWSGRLWGTGGVGASWQRCGQAPDPGAVRVRAGESARQRSRECRQGAQAACRWVRRLVPGSAAIEGRGSPRELSVEGGLRSEARSRHGPAMLRAAAAVSASSVLRVPPPPAPRAAGESQSALSPLSSTGSDPLAKT